MYGDVEDIKRESGMSIDQHSFFSLCGDEARLLFLTRYESAPNVAGQAIEVSTNLAGIYECDNCNIRFTYPTVDPELLTTLYEDSDIDVWKGSSDICSRRGFNERIEAIKKFTQGASILDVGCYTGAFLNCFSKDWTKFGIEPSKKASEVASNKGINMLDKKLPLENENIQFDVIASLNVFEHMLVAMRTVLQKGYVDIMSFFNKEKYKTKPVHFLMHRDHMYVIARKIL
jgi:SAM-dependent methyltransferase